ncbi:MAG: tetratricopeptide repeat protein [Pseudomonadota bacterium]
MARAPQDPKLRLNLARLLIQAGDKPQARAELEDIARLGDRFAGQDEVERQLNGVR